MTEHVVAPSGTKKSGLDTTVNLYILIFQLHSDPSGRRNIEGGSRNIPVSRSQIQRTCLRHNPACRACRSRSSSLAQTALVILPRMERFGSE